MGIIKIRQITDKDRFEVYNLIKTAFETADVKGGDEQDYAEELREGKNYIPQLDLVAEKDGKIVGQVMFTETYISGLDGKMTKALLLSPISVLLEYRCQGIGAALIHEGFRLAGEIGYKSVFLCGDPAYYQRFGFKRTTAYGIRHALGYPEENVMCRELEEGVLNGIRGTVDIC